MEQGVIGKSPLLGKHLVAAHVIALILGSNTRSSVVCFEQHLVWKIPQSWDISSLGVAEDFRFLLFELIFYFTLVAYDPARGRDGCLEWLRKYLRLLRDFSPHSKASSRAVLKNTCIP